MNLSSSFTASIAASTVAPINPADQPWTGHDTQVLVVAALTSTR